MSFIRAVRDVYFPKEIIFNSADNVLSFENEQTGCWNHPRIHTKWQLQLARSTLPTFQQLKSHPAWASNNCRHSDNGDSRELAGGGPHKVGKAGWGFWGKSNWKRKSGWRGEILTDMTEATLNKLHPKNFLKESHSENHPLRCPSQERDNNLELILIN